MAEYAMSSVVESKGLGKGFSVPASIVRLLERYREDVKAITLEELKRAIILNPIETFEYLLNNEELSKHNRHLLIVDFLGRIEDVIAETSSLDEIKMYISCIFTDKGELLVSVIKSYDEELRDIYNIHVTEFFNIAIEKGDINTFKYLYGLFEKLCLFNNMLFKHNLGRKILSLDNLEMFKHLNSESEASCSRKIDTCSSNLRDRIKEMNLYLMTILIFDAVEIATFIIETYGVDETSILQDVQEIFEKKIGNISMLKYINEMFVIKHKLATINYEKALEKAKKLDYADDIKYIESCLKMHCSES